MARELSKAEMAEGLMVWKRFGIPALVLGVAVIGVLAWLTQSGVIAFEPYGIARLDDTSRKATTHLSDQAVQDQLLINIERKNTAAAIDGDGVLSIRTTRKILPKGAPPETHTLTFDVPLGELDQLVFAMSLSNSDRSTDTWNINVFCQDKLKCISNTAQSPSRGEKVLALSRGEIFAVHGEDKARASLALLERAIAAHGGVAKLDQSKSVSHLKKLYRSEQ